MQRTSAPAPILCMLLASSYTNNFQATQQALACQPVPVGGTL
ncbi:MAG TPA: hypothetical protein VGD98_08990 [Ktedonobacteraceae bacterium]